jgi:ergothioneine biosynthesis protein EgtB
MNATAGREGLDREELLRSYRAIRATTVALTEGLAPEDMVVQTFAEASPTKWHLAHTSWFFEQFVLGPGYRSPHPMYAVLFNSYYQGAGPRWRRDRRGLLSRPTVAEVLAYRAHVDRAMEAFLAGGPAADVDERAAVVEVGLHHEEQHQELLVTDVKTVLAGNPLAPAYRPPRTANGIEPPPLRFVGFPGGAVEIGHAGPGFCFDNERPRHRVWLEPFELADRPVTCGEYLAFLEEDGYRRPELWLSDGWARVEAGGWEAPLYWEREDGEWFQATLSGRRPVEPREPVCHVSYYEADAYARWAHARLPREEEWEVGAAQAAPGGNFLDAGNFHPRPLAAEPAPGQLAQVFGDVWEWTASPYVAYPGFQPWGGTLGEYNGKFMCNQVVLRGGSCATPARHLRPTYRNFFGPEARWQFTGIRLAR